MVSLIRTLPSQQTAPAGVVQEPRSDCQAEPQDRIERDDGQRSPIRLDVPESSSVRMDELNDEPSTSRAVMIHQGPLPEMPPSEGPQVNPISEEDTPAQEAADEPEPMAGINPTLIQYLESKFKNIDSSFRQVQTNTELRTSHLEQKSDSRWEKFVHDKYKSDKKHNDFMDSLIQVSQKVGSIMGNLYTLQQKSMSTLHSIQSTNFDIRGNLSSMNVKYARLVEKSQIAAAQLPSLLENMNIFGQELTKLITSSMATSQDTQAVLKLLKQHFPPPFPDQQDTFCPPQAEASSSATPWESQQRAQLEYLFDILHKWFEDMTSKVQQCHSFVLQRDQSYIDSLNTLTTSMAQLQKQVDKICASLMPASSSAPLSADDKGGEN